MNSKRKYMDTPTSTSEGASTRNHYVLMPWDDSTLIHYSEYNTQGEINTNLLTRWELIQQQLKNGTAILDVEMLTNVICSYNVVFDANGKQCYPSWKFAALYNYFNSMDSAETIDFFKEGGLLSMIRHLCLELKRMVPRVPVLRSEQEMSLRLHQMEIASLLANAFMCTFPKRISNSCPSINFTWLYEGTEELFVEKIKCIIHYFKKVQLRTPIGALSFHRLYIPDHKFPRWEKTRVMLTHVTVQDDGKIEDQPGYLQMDFANRNIGGGVLGRGCVQEEIRFVICPELIISRLFTETLKDTEALLIIGAERCSQYSGYSKTFKYTGDYEDNTEFDSDDQRKTNIIALDAIRFTRPAEQYRESKILRELKKAYVGFKCKGEECLPVATGNWGCGAYRGDPQLKSLLQIMAASQAGRNILYLTFGDDELKTQLQDICEVLRANKVDVGKLYRILRVYNREKTQNQTLFQFVKEAVENINTSSGLNGPFTNAFTKGASSRHKEFNFLNKDERMTMDMDKAERASTSRIRQIVMNRKVRAEDERWTKAGIKFEQKNLQSDGKFPGEKDPSKSESTEKKLKSDKLSVSLEDLDLLNLYAPAKEQGNSVHPQDEHDGVKESSEMAWEDSCQENPTDSAPITEHGRDEITSKEDAQDRTCGKGKGEDTGGLQGCSPSLFSDSEPDNQPSVALPPSFPSPVRQPQSQPSRKLSQTKITDCFTKKL